MCLVTKAPRSSAEMSFSSPPALANGLRMPSTTASRSFIPMLLMYKSTTVVAMAQTFLTAVVRAVALELRTVTCVAPTSYSDDMTQEHHRGTSVSPMQNDMAVVLPVMDFCPVRPEEDLFAQLLGVENPGRYVGGEFGSVQPLCRSEWDRNAQERDLLIAICFPDTYEIGMSNTAIRLLYTMINAQPGLRAERVFAPWPDFEQALRESGRPLYTLESGIPLSEVDIIAFSVGYELAATNILSVLQAGGVPLRTSDREGSARDRAAGSAREGAAGDESARAQSAPLVIAGGPGITNPVPFGAFIDAVFIGEAEGLFPQLASEIAERRKAGQGRAELLRVLRENPHVWYSGKPGPTRRAIWNGFSEDCVRVQFPVAGVKAVQDHGTIEIMRGCPHGCRFCHAGVFYRPYRMKPVEAIIAEAEFLVDTYGYRDITLSSLSSGDYSEIGRLVNELNAHFAGRGVSFALPSLRVSSFTLPIIGGLAAVKKSGLTFAVETPTEWGQLVLNKQVSRQNCVEILREAKRLGWRVAKFYFMIGLPVDAQDGHEPVDVAETALHEARAIVEFVSSVQAEVGININLTVNTFVPKPHTPFQWAPQLAEARALECLYEIRRGLKGRPIKVSWNSPFLSLLEGVITRGDERAGEVVLEAFRRGARMDAWDDQVSREMWREVFADANWDVVGETVAGHDLESALPWDPIESGVSKNYLLEEYKRSRSGELAEQCAPQCRDYCGICNKEARVVDIRPSTPRAEAGAGSQVGAATPAAPATPATPEIIQDVPVQNIDMHDPGCEVKRLLIRFSKTGPAVFLPHLSVVRALERGAIRAGLSLRMSEGFSQHARMEFAQPLSIGVDSTEEIASIELLESPSENVVEELNKALPEGIQVQECLTIAGSRPERKKAPSLGAAYGGAEYLIYAGPPAPARSELAAPAPAPARSELAAPPAPAQSGLAPAPAPAAPAAPAHSAREALETLATQLSASEQVSFCELTEDGLRLMLPSGPTGPVGITRLIERVCERKLPDAELRIRRVRCFARLDVLGDIVGEHDLLVDFLELYRRWESARTSLDSSRPDPAETSPDTSPSPQE
ncbi:MAG: DUF2344 domain-containing protein [Spirochaetaceae bacterium]|nr:MAG: DUF2344 domain-containing protein [Spirochaetaceae bacterium]